MHAITIIILCIGAVIGLPSHTQKIVGGALTTIDNYPSMAALLFSWNGQIYSQACGGAIINNKAILTAAHCPFGDSVIRWRIRLGSSKANSGGVIYTLESISVHPGFDMNSMNNDVAIMRTAKRISYNKVIQPASISGTNYYLGDNEVVWATGWGTISSGGVPSEQLRHVQIWTINQAECRKRYAADGISVTDAMLCSGILDIGGRDQCQGDSGGPLYHNRVIVGVCSFGIGCAAPQYPGVNARVSGFSSWIQANA